MTRSRRIVELVRLCAFQAVLGCANEHASPDADGGPDAWRYDAGPVDPTDDVDLLLVVDDRMRNLTQSTLFRAGDDTVRLVHRLLLGDRDLDGTLDARPVATMRVGVVSGDLGAGMVLDGAGCPSGMGTDGVLLTTSYTILPECMATYAPVHSFAGPAPDPSFHPLECVISSADEGCSFQQPLEAALKALAPAPGPDGRSPVPWTRDDFVPPIFREGTFGHAGPGAANDGLVRADSVLVILFVTLFDDCSTPAPEIFSWSTYPDVPIGRRCFMDPDPRYPISRYVDGFLGLRRSPSRLVVGAVIGLPAGADTSDYGALLSDPRMVETPTSNEQHIESICFSMDGYGYPGRRFVELLEGLDEAGAHTFAASSCDITRPELAQAFDAVQLARAGRP